MAQDPTKPAKPRKPRTTPSKTAPKTAAPKAKAVAKPAPPTGLRALWKPPVHSVRDLDLVWWVAGIIIFFDQLTKLIVVQWLQLDVLREIDLFPPWLNLRMAWNPGMNFGLFASNQNLMRWVLITIALAVCVWVWLWMRRSQCGRLAKIGAGLLIGGAIGNVIDRMTYGAVADFLNMSLPNWRNPYSFNVADIAIFAGAIGLILMPPEPGNDVKTDKTRDEAGKSG